jgi:DNA-binding response OmpR family regulator
MARRRCMIVEDQALIAMALEAYLEEVGFETAGPFMSNAASLQWLHVETPELAVLDVVLTDGPCVQLARELKSRGIPFAIYSGLPSAADAPEELRGRAVAREAGQSRDSRHDLGTAHPRVWQRRDGWHPG